MKQFRILACASLALLLAGTAVPARAQSYLMTMQGLLDSRSSIVSGSPTPIANASPFTLTALFTTTSPSLVAPIGVPGFVAYTPTSMELTLGGRTYAVQPFNLLNPTGLAVAIFDRTTPFGVPGRYGVGVIQNPLADGAGIVADFIGASPDFTLGATGVVPTTFTGFAGVGVSSGVCTAGTPAGCTANAVTPIPLTFQNQLYSLILGTYSADVAPGFSFSTTITAVPEPGSVLLFGMGLAGVAVVVMRRRVQRG